MAEELEVDATTLYVLGREATTPGQWITLAREISPDKRGSQPISQVQASGRQQQDKEKWCQCNDAYLVNWRGSGVKAVLEGISNVIPDGKGMKAYKSRQGYKSRGYGHNAKPLI